MCLSEITSREPTPDGIGYKVFLQWEGFALAPPVMTLPSLIFSRPYGWVTDQSELTIQDRSRGIYYRTGFHIFKNKKDAEAYQKYLTREYWTMVVARVSYRQAHVEGNFIMDYFAHRYSCPCVVAREIKIEEVLTEEEPCASTK
jgi:hypothetical protein